MKEIVVFAGLRPTQ